MNKSHYIPNSFPIKVPFPPPIEESELKPTIKKGKLPVRATNQFLLYRTAVIKTLRENGYQDINMRNISKMASDLWSNEPEFVQQEYKILALRAKGLHQRTAKYLTSYRLKDTISQRPLAPMPKSTPVPVSPTSLEIKEINENMKCQLDGLDYNTSTSNIMSNDHITYPQIYYYNTPNAPPQYIITQPQELPPNNLPVVFPNNDVYGYNLDYFG
jgi:hypothetical protein